ncbi:hypothetical protein CBR_g63114 [Chara braunii]|uniref:F-box domain-containing protein n=1 Tax=Chara braunii TaxID=69332 RepID=A0A388K927_CHABU|nr:hypothetical protein CBR_g63114 [Chara braunii]|eukprot:GBG66531.1 hypothetical protein CBR_g63114 [Chara braunii]
MGDERATRKLRIAAEPTMDAGDVQAYGGRGGSASGVTPQRQHQEQCLIPGLNNDLALECLVRVPREYHFQMKCVSRGWRSLLRGDDFYSHRARNRLTEYWIYVLTYERNEPKNTWQAYDPRCVRWHKLPDMPETYRSALGLRAAVLHNMLFVFGGKEGMAKKEVEGLWKFDPRTLEWSMGARMLNPRAHFASAVVNGSLFVAGGFGADGKMLNSAEVYNPLEDSWQAIEPMAKPMAWCHGLGLRGCFYVRDKCPPSCGPGPVRVIVYDTATRTWLDVKDSAIVKGWRGATAVADGRVYVTNQYEMYCLKVFEPEMKCWIQAPGIDRLFLSCYSKKQKPPFKLAGFDGKIVAAGRGPTLTIIDVRKAMETRRNGGGGAEDGEEGVVEVADNTALWSTVWLSGDSNWEASDNRLDTVESVQVIGL